MKNRLVIIAIVTSGLIFHHNFSQAQSYSINGDLGIDTIPSRKLDVNGDGRFKGELLLDDVLRIPKLGSNDSLLKRLLFVDENGRMNRIDSLVNNLTIQMHNPNCISNLGEDPTVFWNTKPGKIYAFSELCNFTPNVGIGTSNPEARLHVRGESYFSEKVGIGILNESTTRLQISANTVNKGFEVLRRTVEGGIEVTKPVFYINGDGTTKLYNIPVASNALSLRNEDNPDTDVFSLFGYGGIRLIMDRDEGTRAFWIRNEDDEEAFHLKSNGQMILQGMGEANDALTINGDVDGDTGFKVKGNGFMEQRVSGNSDDAVIRIVDTDLSEASGVFEIQKNGEIKIQHQQPDNHVLSARNTETLADEWNVIIKADGRISLKGSENDKSAFSIKNSDDQETFNIRGKGQVTMDRSHDTEDYPTGLKIITPENTAFKVIDVTHSGLSEPTFRVWGDGRIEQNFDGIGNSKAIQLKNLSLSGNQDVFSVWENGQMQLKYAGEYNSATIFRIQNANYDDDDVFRVTGEGKVWATSVHVRLKEDFPDYVFEPGYKLMPLEKLRKYIADNQRLPNMPAAEEVERNGVDLGEMNRLLVEKVEELTLYVLELEERLKAVERK